MWVSRVLDEDCPVHSLDTAADPTSLPHFAAPGPSPARQFHSLASALRPSSLPLSSLPSLPSFLRAFFHSLNQPSKAVSLVCSAGPPNDELAGLCRGPLDLTNRPVIISFRAAPIFVGASDHHQGRGHSSERRLIYGPRPLLDQNLCDRICSISCIRPSCCVNS